MRSQIKNLSVRLALPALLTLNSQLATAFTQDTVLTYQGRVTDNSTNFTGTGQFKFALVTSTNGQDATPDYTTWWSNDGTSTNGSQPAAGVDVTVNNGLFTVALGNTAISNMTAIPTSLFTSLTNLQLLIWFDDGVNGFAMLTPAQNLTPAPYATYAISAGSVAGIVVQPNTNGAPNVIAGSPTNYVLNGVIGATISGGGATNFGGLVDINSVTSDFGTVGGGLGNTSGDEATVGGGYGNTASGYGATVGGGVLNAASGLYATVGGGWYNTASGENATVGGGDDNTASGEYSFAAGRVAQATNQGAFVWADSQGATFASTADNQFLIRAGGGVGIGTNAPATALHVASSSDCEISVESSDPGNHRWTIQSSGSYFGANFTGTFQIIDRTLGVSRLLIATNGDIGVGNTSPTNLLVVGTGGAYCNGTTWVNGSDRNSKRDFAAINPREVLEKVSALPITEWQYKVDASGLKHMGPMAQDFHAAFGLNGGDDQHIATVDEGGVALAAIQGLNQKMEAENAALKNEVAELKALVRKLANSPAK